MGFEKDYTKEYEYLINEYEKLGGQKKELLSKEYGSIVINSNKVLAVNQVEGIEVITKPIEDGVDVTMLVKKGTKVKNPVHLCFGMVPKEGTQRIISHYTIEEDAKVSFVSHCIFPNAVKINHIMDAEIEIKANAEMSYHEEHFHGKTGGVNVYPHSRVHQGPGSKFLNTFKMIKGRAGMIDINYVVDLDEQAVCEMEIKAFGKADDKIKTVEKANLNGAESRALLKSRVVLKDQSSGEIYNETNSYGDRSRAHIDCIEIVENEATANAVPVVNVLNPTAKVTHEAAIGSIDKVKIETLMARGLTETEAIDTIVKAFLK